MPEKKRIPSISIESQEIYRRLEKCTVGELVPYAELSQLAMGDIQHGKRFALVTARRRILDEKGWVFEAVVNEGVKRLNDSEILSLGEATVGRIHRAAHRGLRKISCVDYDALTKNQQIDHNTKMSVMAALDHITKPRQIKQIEARVQQTNQRLMLRETLESFDSNAHGDKVVEMRKAM